MEAFKNNESTDEQKLDVLQRLLLHKVHHHHELFRIMMVSGINGIAVFSGTLLIALVAFMATDQVQDAIFCGLSPTVLDEKLSAGIGASERSNAELLRCSERISEVAVVAMLLGFSFIATLAVKALLAAASRKLSDELQLRLQELTWGELKTRWPTEELNTGSDRYLVLGSVGLFFAAFACCLATVILFHATLT